MTKICICFDMDKIYIGIVTCHFSQICNSVKALDGYQNFVSAQYLENKWMEFHPILYYAFILARSGLLPVTFLNFLLKYDP